VPFARATPWPFIAGNAAGVGAVLAAAAFVVPPQGPWGGAPAFWTVTTVGVAGIGWVVLLIFFFRDPQREVAQGVVSPADGRVTSVETGAGRAAVTIVLGVFNVHVVRAPTAGRLVAATHRPGAKRVAASKDAQENERLVMEFEGEGEHAGATVRLTLIAGAFADRTVSYMAPGEAVEKGQRVGIIKFGSRVDLEYLGGPPVRAAVAQGVTVKAAQSQVLAPERAEGLP
jgi:phosphatidylserine decarboxylase